MEISNTGTELDRMLRMQMPCGQQEIRYLIFTICRVSTVTPIVAAATGGGCGWTHASLRLTTITKVLEFSFLTAADITQSYSIIPETLRRAGRAHLQHSIKYAQIFIFMTLSMPEKLLQVPQ